MFPFKCARRSTLENPHTGERQGFTTLADLVIALQEKMDDWNENPGPVKGEELTK